MRRLNSLTILVIAALIVGSTGCVDVRDRTADAVGTADDRSDPVRFCLALTRAVNAVESGAPDTARDAVEEAVVHAPASLLADVRDLADRVRTAEAAGPDALRDPDLVADAQAIREEVRELCNPPATHPR